MKIFNIVPECNVDTRIVEVLGRIVCVGHKHGKGNVSRELEKALQNNIALGIVDEDANKGPEPKYFAIQFKEIRREHNLVLKKHSSASHFLIIICPEIEKWLNENALTVNLLPTDYGLPENFTGFIKLCKSKDIRKNFQFDNFIKAMIKEKAPGIVTLKTWIEQFLAGEKWL
ncbi:MAG: hypothetical protein M3R72_03015 [Bacteroidota bacterium]|nr:hypothetical protein [Bacteroidota bacterium]